MKTDLIVVGTISDPNLKELVEEIYGKDVASDLTAQVQIPYLYNSNGKVYYNPDKPLKMSYKEAIRAIKCNWPPEKYSMLREALTIAVDLLEKADCSQRNSHEDHPGMEDMP